MSNELLVKHMFPVVFDKNRHLFKTLDDVLSMERRFEYDGRYGIVFYENEPIPTYNILASIGYTPNNTMKKPIVVLDKDQLMQVLHNEFYAYDKLTFNLCPKNYVGQVICEIVKKDEPVSRKNQEPLMDMFTQIFGEFPPKPMKDTEKPKKYVNYYTDH